MLVYTCIHTRVVSTTGLLSRPRAGPPRGRAPEQEAGPGSGAIDLDQGPPGQHVGSRRPLNCCTPLPVSGVLEKEIEGAEIEKIYTYVAITN